MQRIKPSKNDKHNAAVEELLSYNKLKNLIRVLEAKREEMREKYIGPGAKL